MSEGSSAALYLSDYLGWDEKRLARGLARSRRIYRALGIRDRLLTLERATRAYVFSKWARDLNVRWGADPQKLDVVYPGFPIPELPRREPREEFRFLFVGRDFERKGGFEVVEAFERVLEQFPNARLTMAGDDPAARNPDREVHSWVDDARRDRAISTLRRLQAQGVVETRPWLDRRVLYGEIYGQADVFVMPTHAEGFGFTNVEAMSFALPVITSTAGPSAEIVPAGRAGLLVPAGDVESLTSAMSELLRDETRARRMGDAGRAEFLRRFTTDTFRAELGKLYQRALEAG
jgi:glycosyltransferase involved in cell wall biosynthesis